MTKTLPASPAMSKQELLPLIFEADHALGQLKSRESITCWLGRRPTLVNVPATFCTGKIAELPAIFTFGVPARLTAGSVLTLTVGVPLIETAGVPARLTGGSEFTFTVGVPLMDTAGIVPTFTVGVLTTLTFWVLVVVVPLAAGFVCASRASAATVTARQLRMNKSLARNARNFIKYLLICVLPLGAGPKIGLHFYRRRIKAEFAPPAEFFSVHLGGRPGDPSRAGVALPI